MRQSLTERKWGCSHARLPEVDLIAPAIEGEHADPSPCLVIHLDHGDKAAVEVDVGHLSSHGNRHVERPSVGGRPTWAGSLNDMVPYEAPETDVAGLEAVNRVAGSAQRNHKTTSKGFHWSNLNSLKCTQLILN